MGGTNERVTTLKRSAGPPGSQANVGMVCLPLHPASDAMTRSWPRADRPASATCCHHDGTRHPPTRRCGGYIAGCGLHP